MRNTHRIRIVILTLILACTLAAGSLFPAPLQAFGVSSAAASGETDSAAYAESLVDGIRNYLLTTSGCSDLQQFIDTELCLQAGRNAEWYVFALSRSGKYDFSKYRDALSLYLNQADTVPGPVTLQKYAYVTLAAGGGLSLTDRTLAQTVGAQGIMSYVFGLHLWNNGARDGTVSAESVVRSLLSLQLEDGGWAISGRYGDPDVTSMTVQALACYLIADPAGSEASGLAETVRGAEDRAVTFLSGRQSDDGGYSSYGSANSESCAQVLTALSELGIDACTDERFRKNGRTVLDALASYRCDDGSFRHIAKGDSNENATQQAFYACVAYLRFLRGQSPLHLPSADAPSENPTPSVSPTETPLTPTTAPTGTPLTPTTKPADDPTITAAPSPSATKAPAASSPTDASAPSDGTGFRLPATIAVLAIAAIGILVLALRKRLNRRNLLIALFITAAAIALIHVVRIQTPEDYYEQQVVPEDEANGKITLAIRCDTVAGASESLPADGLLLGPVTIPFRDGDTVYDALMAATATERLPVDIGGAGNSLYIRAIGPLREFDYGSLSGWMYYRNGEAPGESCSTCRLRDGDVIEWRYTRDMGIDTESP